MGRPTGRPIVAAGATGHHTRGRKTMPSIKAAGIKAQ
jgi:hypothetical protein